jgi:hypothetical protein
MAGAACPAEAGSRVVQTFGTAGPFPLMSMLVLLSLASVSSVVPMSLAGVLESEASC